MARKQHYAIQLSTDERQGLQPLLMTGAHSSRVQQRAQMLLWSDEGKSDLEIAALLQVTPLTVAQTRRRWVETHQVQDRPRPGVAKKLDEQQQALLIALASGDPPEGHQRWTMQLLADRLLELGVVKAPISYETVRRTLKDAAPSKRDND